MEKPRSPGPHPLPAQSPPAQPESYSKKCPPLIGISRLRMKSVIPTRPASRPPRLQAHACPRAHAGICPSDHPYKSRSEPRLSGPRSRGRRRRLAVVPAKITKLVDRHESLRVSFAPSCLCGWPWLLCYIHQLIIMKFCSFQSPLPEKLPLPEAGRSGPTDFPVHLARALASQPGPPGGRRLSFWMAFVEKHLHRRGPRATAKNCPSLIDLSAFA